MGKRHPAVALALCFSLCMLPGCATAERPVQFLSGATLVYPPAAKAAGIEGSVTVRYDVTADGTVTNAQVVAAKPAGVFEEAALSAIRQWRFRAAVAGGVAVPTRNQESTLRFTLGEGNDYAGF